MSKIVRILLSVLVVSILIAGCGSADTSTPVPSEVTGDVTEAPDNQKGEDGSQDLEDMWMKNYGGSAEDNVSAILQAEDDGYYLLGGTNIEYEPERHGDIYLIFVDSNGEMIWEKTFGPDKWGHSIGYSDDGNVIIAGTTRSEETGMDPYLMQIDPDGNELWSKTISGPKDEWINTIEATVGGGYILVGNSVDPEHYITYPGVAGYGGFEYRSNIMLINTDEDGEVVWSNVYETEKNVMSVDGCQTPDGGYVVLASIIRYPDMDDDQLLMKVDENGEEVWSYTWEEGRVGARDLLLTADGNLLILSLYSASGDPREGDADLLITKMSEDGEELWTTNFGEPDIIEMGSAVAETKKGDFVIVADRTRDLYNSTSEMVLIKIDTTGEVIWEKVMVESPHFMIRCIIEHPRGGYLLAASNYRRERADILLIKTDADGNVAE